MRRGEALGEELVFLGLGPVQENKNPFFRATVARQRKTRFTKMELELPPQTGNFGPSPGFFSLPRGGENTVKRLQFRCI